MRRSHRDHSLSQKSDRITDDLRNFRRKQHNDPPAPVSLDAKITALARIDRQRLSDASVDAVDYELRRANPIDERRLLRAQRGRQQI